MKKIFFSLMAAGLCLTANAQLEDGGNYFIKNVATGTYMTGGNAWGTHISVSPSADYFTAAAISDGVYTLDSHIANNASNHFVGNGDFLDAAVANLTIASVGEGVYTISPADGQYYAVTSGTLVEKVAEVTDKAKWQFITLEEYTASLASATQAAPLSATLLIRDANFGRNNQFKDQWNNTGAGNMSGGNNTNNCAESWRAAFDVNQTITVPNGVYALTAQAALTDYTNAYDGANYPVVYANTETSVFNEMESSDRGTSMSQLSASFTDGKYVVDPIYVQVTDGTLKVGVRGTRTDTWCIWDNFQLTYYGADASLAELKLAGDVAAYRTALQNAEAVDQEAKMGPSELAALKKALEDYPESKVITASATSESLKAAKTALESATSNATTSITKYANDKTRRDQYAARATAAGVTVSTAAFDAAYEAATLANELADLKSALDTEVSKVVAAYADKSEVITNPSFENENRTEGWTLDNFGNAATNKNFGKLTGDIFVEKWIAGPGKLSDGSIKQTVTLPAGVYILTAEAQLLQQGNSNIIPGGMYIYAGENQVEVTNQAETYVVAFNIAADDTEVEIGAKLVGSTGNWASIDHFQIKTLAKVTGAMNADVKAAQDAAFAAYATDATAEKKAALLTAMANANASVAEYTAIDAAITASKETAATYGEAAVDAYDDSAVKTGYANGTYETAAAAKKELNAALATAVTTTCAAGTNITSLVANAGCNNGKAAGGWTATPDPTESWYVKQADGTLIDFGRTMCVNTWSVEGDTDESNMKTAFTQIWGFTPSQDINVMHDQIEGLAKGNYTVTILARVRDFKNGATTPAGISFKANGTASTTEWTAGDKCSYATLTVNADVTEDGTLDFGFSYVKEEVNFTWLSFKDVTLTYMGDATASMEVDAEANYGTFCAPFDVTVPEGVTASTVTLNGKNIVLSEGLTTIPANTPVVLFVEGGLTATTVYGKAVEGSPKAGALTGVLEDTEITEGYVLQNQEENGVGFYKVGKETITVPANRCYLTAPTAGAKAFYFEGAEATGINAVEALTSGKAQIYDINGRQLQKLQKGINIVNGVKVLVK